MGVWDLKKKYFPLDTGTIVSLSLKRFTTSVYSKSSTLKLRRSKFVKVTFNLIASSLSSNDDLGQLILQARSDNSCCIPCCLPYYDAEFESHNEHARSDFDLQVRRHRSQWAGRSQQLQIPHLVLRRWQQHHLRHGLFQPHFTRPTGPRCLSSPGR